MGMRIDLIFLSPSGRLRVCEVKSGKCVTEADKIQAALYWRTKYHEVCVSTKQTDLLLTPSYIQEQQAKANVRINLLSTRPDLAVSQFTPHPAACKYCVNTDCPFLKR
jgi:hypothetical protein